MRGLGILLVVYGHVARGLVAAGVWDDSERFRLLDSAIYAFHMPLFFFLSGMFVLATLRRRGHAGFVAAKIDTLVWPYLVWSLVYGLARLVLGGETNGVGLTFWDLFRFDKPKDHLWFLFGLFFIFLLSMVPLWRPWRLGVVVLVVLSLVLYATRLRLPLPWQQIYVVPFLPYFAAGAALPLLEARLPERWRASTVAPAAVELIAAAVLLAAAAALAGSDLLANPRQTFEPGVATLCLALAGTLGVCGLARLLDRWSIGWVPVLGAASLFIYLSHTLLASGTRIGLQRVAGVTDPTLHLVAGLAAGLLLPVLLLRLLPGRLIDPLLRSPKPLALGPRFAPGAPAKPLPPAAAVDDR